MFKISFFLIYFTFWIYVIEGSDNWNVYDVKFEFYFWKFVKFQRSYKSKAIVRQRYSWTKIMNSHISLRSWKSIQWRKYVSIGDGKVFVSFSIASAVRFLPIEL